MTRRTKSVHIAGKVIKHISHTSLTIKALRSKTKRIKWDTRTLYCRHDE